jgi:hypothetical protein
MSAWRRSILAISASMSASGFAMSALTVSNSASLAFMSASAGSMLLHTVSPASSWGSWGRYPTRRPFCTLTSPSKAVSLPARIFISVLFPAPLAPRIPILAPR